MTVLHHQSVVILGAMNPAIHHPAWYHAMSIIAQTEFEESLNNQVVVTPPIAQFVSKSFSIVCTQDRWQVSCETEDGTRIVALAKATFEKLDHTPVSAYGINHDFHADTGKQISPTLVSIVRQTGLPFPADELGTTASIIYTADVNDCTFKTVVSTSPRGPHFLHLQNNAHFLIRRDEIRHFDLGPLLEEAFQRNEDRSQSMLLNFVNAIKELN